MSYCICHFHSELRWKQDGEIKTYCTLLQQKNHCPHIHSKRFIWTGKKYWSINQKFIYFSATLQWSFTKLENYTRKNSKDKHIRSSTSSLKTSKGMYLNFILWPSSLSIKLLKTVKRFDQFQIRIKTWILNNSFRNQTILIWLKQFDNTKFPLTCYSNQPQLAALCDNCGPWTF